MPLEFEYHWELEKFLYENGFDEDFNEISEKFGLTNIREEHLEALAKFGEFKLMHGHAYCFDTTHMSVLIHQT
jgi:hypothetical protein